MDIAVDFDGTLVVHDYPRIGGEVPHAFEYLKLIQKYGGRLILYTMRSGEFLLDAIQFCRDRGVEFWGINTNPDQKIWTDSPKCYAQLYVDDAALGAPLTSRTPDERLFVDWMIAGPSVLAQMGMTPVKKRRSPNKPRPKFRPPRGKVVSPRKG